MSTLVIIVDVEEVVEAAGTVVKDVGDVTVIVSVGVVKVGETMVDKDVGKGGAVVFREIILILFWNMYIFGILF